MSKADIEPINYNDIEVYKANMQTAEMEYIQQFPDKDDLYNTDVFNGLIDYINLKVFKADKRTRQFKANAYYNGVQNSVLDYSDTETLYGLWIYYKLLCSKYKKTPTQWQYCTFTGVSKETFNDWMRGDTRKASPSHMQLVKKIHAECEAVTAGKVINNNSVGAMFILKAGGFQWREDQHVVLETQQQQHDSAEQIASRHATAELPEKPQLETFEQ